jgi:aquaporin Z
MMQALRTHWPEYLMEAALLGLFMVSACTFGVLLDHPDSPVPAALPDPFARRILGGMAMGLTAIALIYSPWGKQSGAHMNPSITLAFLRLDKVKPWDALFYVLGQFAGGIAGVLVAYVALRTWLAHRAVNYVVTQPGPGGLGPAFLGELVISFLMMSMVLYATSTPGIERYTGLCAGALVATYITLEAPLSGMSMNPARTFGSAFVAGEYTALWLYFLAPPLAMLGAAELRLRLAGGRAAAHCAKLRHAPEKRCIFCGYRPAP